MPRRHEIQSTWLVTCHDDRGQEVNVGAGVTDRGDVVLIGPPPDKIPTLTAEDAPAYVATIRAAWFAGHSIHSR